MAEDSLQGGQLKIVWPPMGIGLLNAWIAERLALRLHVRYKIYRPLDDGKSLGMAKFDRITFDPARLNGEPCIRNLRLTVRRVLETLATYPDREELKREYPELEDEDIRQALGFAAASLDDKVLPPPLVR